MDVLVPPDFSSRKAGFGMPMGTRQEMREEFNLLQVSWRGFCGSLFHGYEQITDSFQPPVSQSQMNLSIEKKILTRSRVLLNLIKLRPIKVCMFHPRIKI